ncbi:hypothetical protein [Streptomyces sp. HNA39]|uniref:hypothetical protein n=1 Tax=Streptomyces sp. HNA39 TaxID=2850561 RepID=UPI00200CFCD6|nr:hypothetical protein [Streptomyces sp. HNA39]UQA37505.1 hypothetical protein KRR37_30105 [Streptomyces sp. HNA39]
MKALQEREVFSGVTRCISEERALVLQLVRAARTGRVTVVQYPVAGIQEAYDRLAEDDMLPELDHIAYFIVASAEALEQAEVDGTPYMRTLRPSGRPERQAEILRAPYRVQRSSRA